ncbi:MAG: MFS transporter [Deltaproteobacteria bacterium]|nr:MAG: MFS transporter [Deltaproteobacteria bacterium]
MAQTLTASVRHGYGVAAYSLAIANTSVMFFLLKYLVDAAHLSPATAGTVFLVGKLWDAVSDPLIGRLSDRTNTSMGARRPWIAGGSVPFILLFAGIWWGLPLEGWAAAAGYAMLLVAYNTGYTSVVVPYGALTPVLTQDYDERTKLNAARMGWSMAGGLTAAILMPTIRDATGNWGYAGAVLGVLMIPGLLIMLRTTKGRDIPPEEPEDSPPMWSVMSVQPFRRTAFLFLAAWSTIAVLGALVPFYVEHHLHAKHMVDALLAAIQISALVFIPMVVWLSGKVEKHTAYAMMIGSWALVMLALSAVPTDAVYLALAMSAFTGPGVAAAHVLPWSMLPDVVEVDRVENGVDRAGAFYGMMTFLEKMATAVAGWALGMGLEISGYVEGAEVQSQQAVNAVRIMIGPIPAAVLVVAAVSAVMLPPLTREAHKALVAKLDH